ARLEEPGDEPGRAGLRFARRRLAALPNNVRGVLGDLARREGLEGSGQRQSVVKTASRVPAERAAHRRAERRWPVKLTRAGSGGRDGTGASRGAVNPDTEGRASTSHRIPGSAFHSAPPGTPR